MEKKKKEEKKYYFYFEERVENDMLFSRFRFGKKTKKKTFRERKEDRESKINIQNLLGTLVSERHRER